MADDVERRMDALGWDTAHIVGNSLGGWVAFELERRGRARTLTGIAPAGGWSHFTPGEVRDRRQVPRGLAGLADRQVARPAGAAPAVRPPACVPAGQCHSRRPQRRRPDRHHRRRLPLPRLLPPAGQGAAAAGPAGAGQWQRADASGHLREGPGAAASAVHPPLHHAPARGHADHPSRRRRAHPDVRGAAAGSPT